MKDYTAVEKKALLAILKFLAADDGQLSESELEKFDRLASEQNFNDFQKVFAEVDAEVKSLNDLSSLVNAVTDPEKQNDIFERAVDMAGADTITRSENEVIRYLGRVWNLDV